MATLTGKTIASTYKDLLQVSNSNSGIDGTKRAVSDGEATESPLELSSSAVNISSGFELGGSAVTASATELNVMDGSETAQATVTLAGTDGVVISDDGTMKQALVSDFEVYMEANLDTFGATTVDSLSVSDGNITNVGDISLDSISSDAGTSINVVLGSDVGDDFIVDGTTLVVEGDTNRVGIGTDSPDKLLDIDGVAVIGNAPSTSADVPLELKGMGVSDGANPYGNYGGILFSADGNYTGSAHKFLITNALNANKFAIIRSSNATTDPTLGTAGAITSGTADFVIDTDGNVGIGTDSPDNKLHIYEESSIGSHNFTNYPLKIESKDTSGDFWDNQGAGIKFENTASSGAFISAEIVGETSGADGTKGELVFKTSTASTPTERLRIDSAGRVGIGTTAPQDLLQVGAHTSGAPTGEDASAIFLQGIGFFNSDLDTSPYQSRIAIDTGTTYIQSNEYYNGGWQIFDSARAPSRIALSSADADSKIMFYTKAANSGGPTERLRIDSSGTLRTTSSDGTAPTIGTGCVSIWGRTNSSSTGVLRVYKSGDDGQVVDFYRTGNTFVGSISVTSSSTAYNTSSDYRLKENDVLISDGLDRLNQLRPIRFNFKSDVNKTVDGFFAHEAGEVVPECVTGTKDAMMDKEVSPSIQAVEAVIGQSEIAWTDKPSEENTKDEIKAWMDTNSLSYNSGDTKSDLINKIPEFQQEFIQSVEAVEAVEAVYESVPDYQGIDQSKLVPLLVSAIQELSAKVEALESK